jgi:tetratricopeptide (TPR) repeat protein
LEEAMSEAEIAISLDPLSSITQHGRAFILSEQGDVEQSIRAYEEIIKRDPQFDLARSNLVLLYGESGRVEDARRLLDDEPRERLLLEGASGDPQARAQALEALGQPDLRESISLQDVASLYMMMGAPDSAIAFLHRAADAREPSIGYAANARSFAALRSKPEFKEFRRKLRLPD